MNEDRYKRVLEGIKEENMFSARLSMEEYIDGLKKRFIRVYGEILQVSSYKSIVKQLQDKNIITEQEIKRVM